MRILKIALQNINSLKSDAPIIIDFDSDLFKDVGLFAITGSTGAGKTTILDAITIALYHSVPRFNNGKGALVDVVSHGAHEAFASVEFENEQVIYEAYWGIRLASKTGKLLANPQEEVSFKNLTTNTILSTQKRAVIEDVVKVTQLDYTQFLRSVMLAQGEFASFLTAKGPEKGRLLEQITGEEIYKKIGRGILERKSKEEGKLKEIQAKINADDVLSEARKAELMQKDADIAKQIDLLEKELSAVQTRINWFDKSKELTAASLKLAAQEKELANVFDQHKTEFELLDLNEKAEPFKELIQNYNRNEKDGLKKAHDLKDLETELTDLKPKIAALKLVLKTETAKLALADKTFTDWQPKFDLITELDGQLKNEADNQAKASAKLVELARGMKELKDEKETIQKELVSLNEKITAGEKYVAENQFLMQVDAEISSWTADLTTLKSLKEALNDNQSAVKLKTLDLEKANSELKANKAILAQKTAEIGKIEQEVEQFNQKLAKNSLTDLLASQQKIASQEQDWKAFKVLAEENTKIEKELADKLSFQKTQKEALEAVSIKIKENQKLVVAQEIAVNDAQKILDLEKSMAKYEADRANLVDGEPCGLCGSKSHPFTEHLPKMSISEAELTLKDRQEKLTSILNLKSELAKTEVENSTHLKNVGEQINVIKSTLESIQLKAKDLKIDVEIHNRTKIDIEINQSVQQLKVVNEKIVEAQKWQTKKDELSSVLKNQNQSFEVLKTTDATLSEKIKNAKVAIEEKQKLAENQKTAIQDLESKLETALTRYKYAVPTPENTAGFIQKIEADISTFRNGEKKLEKLKADLSASKNRLSDLDKQLVGQDKTVAEYAKAKKDSESKATNLKNERIALLPIDVTVEAKREALDKARKELAEIVHKTEKSLQNLVDIHTKKETLRQENLKAQAGLQTELNQLKTALDKQIAPSEFADKKAIENALLEIEVKQKYAENKRQIIEKQVRLKTLTETNLKALEKQNATKNFETSEAENQQQLNEVKVKKDELATAKGEIKEAFRKDQEIKDRNATVYQQIEAQEVICKVWKDLFAVIGNSQDAFNVYVQRLTLKHLLDLANVHLFHLNKRYSLKMEADYKPKEELNFHLIDHYQTDQVRLVDTSSGGEKFIISLALALGLSDLASKNVKIDSLFIDEGFGTLDKHTLETVISTLETLQLQGKMIGIISHVENLKERIPTQIQITKKSNGVSAVEMVQ